MVESQLLTEQGSEGGGAIQVFGRRKKLQAAVDEVWNEAVAAADKEAAEARAAALSAYEAAGPSGEKAYEEAREAIRRRYTQALSNARDAISRDLGPGAILQ